MVSQNLLLAKLAINEVEHNEQDGTQKGTDQIDVSKKGVATAKP